MTIPKATTREALSLLSPHILRLGPHLDAQFKAELAELREDDMLGRVAIFEKWILRLGPHLHVQFKADLADLREDDMLGLVALFEKWNDMLSMYFRATLKKGHS